jgi:hypothetical protein
MSGLGFPKLSNDQFQRYAVGFLLIAVCFLALGVASNVELPQGLATNAPFAQHSTCLVNCSIHTAYLPTFTHESSTQNIIGAGFDGTWALANPDAQDQSWQRVVIDHSPGSYVVFRIRLYGLNPTSTAIYETASAQLVIDNDLAAHATADDWADAPQAWVSWRIPYAVIQLTLSLSADKSTLTVNSDWHFNWACLANAGNNENPVTVTFTSYSPINYGQCLAWSPTTPAPPSTPPMTDSQGTDVMQPCALYPDTWGCTATVTGPAPGYG